MYTVVFSKNFKKSFKKIKQSHPRILNDFEKVVLLLRGGKKLDQKFRDHPLKGDLSLYRECHIRPDILMIYSFEKKECVILLIEIGSHSYLF